MKIWIPVAIVAIFLLLVAGLLPLPGQKDNVTPHTEPSAAGTSPRVEAPSGPPASPPSEPGAGTQPPPGGVAAPTPGGPTSDASTRTMTDASPRRDAK